MATITTTTTSSPVGRHSRHSREGGNPAPFRMRSPRFARDDAFSDRSGTSHCHCEGAQRLRKSRATKYSVGAEPSRRTIASGAGSYHPGSELALHHCRVYSTDHEGLTLTPSDRTNTKYSAPFASQKLSLRRSAATAAISSSKIATTAHDARFTNQKNSAPSADLRALRVQKSYLLITTNV